jgi:cystathionine beta-lyase/cystathionine gamma-synthase
MLRCSVGLEDVEDLREDFERGLAAARAATRVATTAR